MKDYTKQNIEEALQTIGKLEQLLRFIGVNQDVRDLDQIFKVVYKMYQENEKDSSV